jgi:hypothetical protein
LVLPMGGIYKYAVEMASCGMRSGMGVQAILRSCLSNLNGCNVGITDGRDLRSVPLRWHYIRTKFHKDWLRHSKLLGGDTHSETQTAKLCHKPTFTFSK